MIVCRQLTSQPKNQLGSRYEGQLIFMAEPIPHSKCPPRTPPRRSSFFAADGQAETDGEYFPSTCSTLVSFLPFLHGSIPC